MYTITSKNTDKGLFEDPATNTNNFNISLFEIDKEKGLTNLTKIAKHFNKRVIDWKKLPTTQRFLKAFFEKNPEGENLTVVNGGTKNGTWASKKIALKFAEWISVDFEIFANEVLDSHFSGEAQVKLPSYSQALRQLADSLDQKARLEKENIKLSSRDLEVTKVKDFKGFRDTIKKDKGRTINHLVFSKFLDKIPKTFKNNDGVELSYSEGARRAMAHNLAKKEYKKKTGSEMPKAKFMSLELKQDYLNFLAKYDQKDELSTITHCKN